MRMEVELLLREKRASRLVEHDAIIGMRVVRIAEKCWGLYTLGPCQRLFLGDARLVQNFDNLSVLASALSVTECTSNASKSTMIRECAAYLQVQHAQFAIGLRDANSESPASRNTDSESDNVSLKPAPNVNRA